MPQRIQIDSLTKPMPMWDVDASHAVHEDCKEPTGAGMTLGRGAVMLFSRKQKVNTRSSTETELVGVETMQCRAFYGAYISHAGARIGYGKC